MAEVNPTDDRTSPPPDPPAEDPASPAAPLDAEATSPEVPTYYNLPVLKRPVWRWEVWLYFFFGGLSAGCYAIASLATLFGGPRSRAIRRTGYILSFLAFLACPPLLIKDLGRPGRFITMLRVFKPSSPMSMGVWGLVGYSGFTTFAFLREVLAILGDPFARLSRWIPGRALAVPGTALACFFGSYTGVLLSVTSVPLWSKTWLLGPIFLAAAFSSGSSAIALVLSLRRSPPEAALQQLGPIKPVALLTEAAALAGYLALEGKAARPLLARSAYRLPFLGGAVGLGILLPLLTGCLNLDRGRARPLISGAALLGSLLLRYSIVMAGHNSAADPVTYLSETQE